MCIIISVNCRENQVGLIGQLVEHCTGIAEVRVQIPFKREFLRISFRSARVTLIHNCDDQHLNVNSVVG